MYKTPASVFQWHWKGGVRGDLGSPYITATVDNIVTIEDIYTHIK